MYTSNENCPTTRELRPVTNVNEGCLRTVYVNCTSSIYASPGCANMMPASIQRRIFDLFIKPLGAANIKISYDDIDEITQSLLFRKQDFFNAHNKFNISILTCPDMNVFVFIRFNNIRTFFHIHNGLTIP